MGDMAELGANAPQMHADIGLYAKQKGILHLLTFGELSAKAAMLLVVMRNISPRLKLWWQV